LVTATTEDFLRFQGIKVRDWTRSTSYVSVCALVLAACDGRTISQLPRPTPSPSPPPALTFIVSGTVTADGAPVADVRVFGLEQDSAFAITDENGQYRIAATQSSPAEATSATLTPLSRARDSRGRHCFACCFRPTPREA
jgi:hypothetical protein